MPMTATDRPQIDYAPGAADRTTRRVRLLAATVVLLVGCTFVAWKAGPRAWERVQLLYWQQRALTHLAPADLVVYDNKPELQSRAWKPEGGSRRLYDAEGAAYVCAGPWAHFYELCSSTGRQNEPTLFLHELTSPGGNRRLVAVEGSASSPPDSQPRECDIELRAVVFRPGSFYSPATELASSTRKVAIASDEPSRASGSLQVRVFAGQPDPSDPSHFTVRFEANDKRGTLDGWLLNDDTLRCEVRRELAR